MTERLRLEIPVVLPEVASEADACVTRLVADLQAREGVKEAHVLPGGEGRPAQLCVHYAPEVLSLRASARSCALQGRL